MVAILKLNNLSPRDLFKHTILAKGRKSGTTAGSRVTDMAELRKCLCLCMLCEDRFDKQRYGYQRARDIPIVRGKCDGCEQYFGCATFLRPEQ